MFLDGFITYKYKELDSTNSEALRLINNGVIKNNSVIVADQQTLGKGRKNKTWISPQGNLYFTLVTQLDLDIHLISKLSFIITVVVGELLRDVKYKWPNDILMKGRKVCGILLENHSNGYVIIGVGINIVNSPNYATYISKHYDIDSWSLLQNIIKNFSHGKIRWLNNGFDEVRKKWLSKAWNLNNILKINVGNEVFEGEFIDIDRDGKLILQNGAIIHKINSGEVFL